MYALLYALVWTVTWLPLRALYILSDLFIYPIAYYIVGYRRKVIRTNIDNSFTDKSPKERRRIEKRFYHFLADMMVESVYGMHMSEKELEKRVVIEGSEEFERLTIQYGGAMIMTSHHCNWEWLIYVDHFYRNKKNRMYYVYQELHNPLFDKLMTKVRTRFKAKPVEKKRLLRQMVENKRACAYNPVYGMVGDQSPSKNSIHYWSHFLNQPTPMITGTETLAKKFGYPVFFLKTTYVKRGHYLLQYQLISEKPEESAEFEISEKYSRLLEQTILQGPAYWLWSHNRWKHKHRYNPNEGKS